MPCLATMTGNVKLIPPFTHMYVCTYIHIHIYDDDSGMVYDCLTFFFAGNELESKVSSRHGPRFTHVFPSLESSPMAKDFKHGRGGRRLEHVR